MGQNGNNIITEWYLKVETKIGSRENDILGMKTFQEGLEEDFLACPTPGSGSPFIYCHNTVHICFIILMTTVIW